MTPHEFRKLALACAGATESSHVKHPDFRFGGKIFASLGAPDETWGMVKLTPEQQRTWVEKAPAVFKPCSGAWGRSGYTNVRLAAATARLLRPALSAAYENVVSQAKTKKSRTRSTARTKGSAVKPHVVHHKDGSVWARGQVIGATPTGYWEWFRKDGTRLRSGYFDQGEQVGEWTTYDKKGNVYKVTTMKPTARPA